MPLVLDPARHSEATLRELVTGLRADLAETLEYVRSPRGPVRNPAGLEAAEDLLRSALAAVDAPASTDRADLARRANLAYAAMVAAIDLVKSHTDVPRVPARRPG